MYLHRPDRDPPQITSQFSLRVALLSGLTLALFAVVFFRLWYLEILSGDKYLDQANDNRVREVRVQAPRGQVLDRDGKVLVDNRMSLALQIRPQDLPDDRAERAELFRRLAGVAKLDPKQIKQAIRDQQRELPNSPVTLRQDIGTDKIYYLREHQPSFPGVSVERVFLRDYKQGELAAHLFGNVGEISAKELDEPRYQALQQGDTVGQSGIEYEYDRYLRGEAGETRLTVDALGRPKGGVDSDPATPGNNVRLTIDSDVQAIGEDAMSSFGLPGAFVAMDVESGEVIAMGSNPKFNPTIFTKPLTTDRYRQLTSEKNDAPLIDRAIQGLYPTGSVFKPITAVAALDKGLITPGTIVQDTGVVKVDVLKFKNAGDAVFGPINLIDALKVSSDVFFYKLGIRAPTKGDHGLIQDWARDLGLGSPTGIDLPGEASGTIPTPAWRDRINAEGIGDGRPWRLGDNINLSVGQGDVQADPLQVAVAYATIANGGQVVRPHLVQRVEDVSGRALHEVRPSPRRKVEIDEGHREAILDGLNRAAMEERGTSYQVFGNFPVGIAGKTGTAERPHGNIVEDQSWYVALAPYPDPRIVVAVTAEKGGFGVDTAAPVAARMVERYLGLPIGTPEIPVPEQPGSRE